MEYIIEALISDKILKKICQDNFFICFTVSYIGFLLGHKINLSKTHFVNARFKKFDLVIRVYLKKLQIAFN